MKKMKSYFLIAASVVVCVCCIFSSSVFAQTASYAALKGSKTVLYIRPFDGNSFGPVAKELEFSSLDDIRGWSWNGTTASYAALKGSKSVLYIRPFDGSSFGSVAKEIEFSSLDDIRGWSWGLQ